MVELFTATLVAQESLSDRLWIVTLLLHRSAGFLPGQYKAIHTATGKTMGPFSVSSTPADLPKVVFCLRHRLELEIGEVVELSAPRGALVFPEPDRHYILCAGGTGITPFLSLMKAHPAQSLTCLWSIKDDGDLMLLDHFKIKQPVQIHRYSEGDREDLQTLIAHEGFKDQHIYYLAGPYSFVQVHGDWLLKQGVEAHRIFSDMKKFV